MSNSPTKLNVHVPWQRLLHGLGLKSKSHALPAVAECPLCHAMRLLILQDYVVGGQWHYCPSCRLSGDMIQLASAAWNMSVKSTIPALHNKGFVLPGMGNLDEMNKTISQYEKRRTKYMARFNAMWEKAKDGRVFSGDGGKILHNIGLVLYDIPKTYRQSRIGELIGSYPSDQIEEVFQPGTVNTKSFRKGDERTRYENRAGIKIFKGRGWGDVLVIPHFDLPGRLCAFTFLDRRGPLDEYHIIHKTLHMGIKTSMAESGLSYHPDTQLRSCNTVYAISDPIQYMRMHFKHNRTSHTLLPLVLWTENESARTRQGWQAFRGRRVVFWERELNGASFYQAIQANGYVSTMGLAEDSEHQLTNYFQRFPAAEVLQRLGKKAKHWPEAMSDFVAASDDGTVQDMLTQLHLRGLDPRGIVAQLHQRVIDRASQILRNSTSSYHLVVDSMQVEERNGCWYRLGTGRRPEELVSTAILRIDSIIYHRSAKKTYYKGRIIFGDEQVDFIEDKQDVENNTLDWMHQKLIEEGKGVMQYLPSWNKRAINLAQQIQQPELIEGSSEVGWNDTQSTFLFPNFRIKFGGESSTDDTMISLDDTPCRYVGPPTDVFAPELSRITEDTPGNVSFWATWTLIASNVLAAAVRVNPTGIAVAGSTSLSSSRAAVDACGLIHRELLPKQHFQGFREMEAAHQVPVAFNFDRVTNMKRIRAYVTETDMARNCVLVTDKLQAPVIALSPDWHCVWSPTKEEFEPGDAAVLSTLLPSFLKHVCQRQLRDFYDRDQFVALVFDAVDLWLSQLGVQTEVVRRAKAFSGAGSKATVLARWLGTLMDAGKLHIVPSEFNEERNALWRISLKQRLFIPKSLLKLHAKRTTASFDNDNVTAMLSNADALVAEESMHYCLGWLVKETWWNKEMQLMRKDRVTKLKLYG